MNVRKSRQKAGQSLVLFALMMVFIIGMIGLAVDLGNTYGRERRSQNGANAAAVAGMNAILLDKSTNGEVWDNVRRAVAGNRAEGVNFKYWADYIKSDGTKVPLGEWNGSSGIIYTDATARPPTGINRIQVTMEEQVDTFFVRAFGFDRFRVSVNGNSCMGGFSAGVLPLAVPLNLVKSTIVNGAPQPYHNIFTDGNLLSTSNSSWGVWDKMVNRSVELPIESWSPSKAGSHVGWLNWTSTSDLAAAMTFPGSLQLGFNEGPAMDARLPNSKPLNKLTLGDWVSGSTGVKGSLISQLQKLQADNREIGLPIYDTAGEQSGNISFHVVRMGYFRIETFNMSSSPSIRLKYLGDKQSTATECAGEPNFVPNNPPNHYTIAGKTELKRVWGSEPPGPTTYDIVIVMDRSGSMEYDWEDDREGTSDYGTARMEAARKAVRDFVRNYKVEADPDARMAFLSFGGEGGGAVTQEVGWTDSGCTEFEITSTLCVDNKKWTTIQDRANSITPNGLTPGPLAFESVRTLLQDRRTPPAGKNYAQIVLFATDGVFNICGSYIDPKNSQVSGCKPEHKGQHVPFDGSYPGTGNESDYYLNNPGYNQMPGRPIWQAQQIAKQIKEEMGARIFVVALTPRGGDFSPAGLPAMSSGGDYYFQADSADTLANIYAQIDLKISNDVCIPSEETVYPANTVIKLSQPGIPNSEITTTTDMNGNFSFPDLLSGTYKIAGDKITLVSPEDGIAREYSRIVNANNPSEEDQLTIEINPERPDGAVSRADINWTTALGINGAPENGCPEPVP